ELAIVGVARQLPDEGARKTPVLGGLHLALDRLRSVVAPPLVTALGVGGAGDRARGRAGVLEDVVVLDACLVRARCRARGGAARLGVAHAGPTATVEAQPHQDL